MKCPIDGTELQMAERHGVEIDYCPRCRGVWLDRGELDKIIDRSEISESARTGHTTADLDHRDRGEHQRHRYERDDDYSYDGHRRRKKGFLGELFDFD
jgi:hypothetical protein